jgi:hypothetical protein
VRYNLSLALAQQWLLVEAESLAREIIADELPSAVACAQLGAVLHRLARHEEGLAALRRGGIIAAILASVAVMLANLMAQDSLKGPKISK